MAMLNFQEYLNNKGKTIEKAQDVLTQKQDKAPAGPEVVKDKKYKFPAQPSSKPLPYLANSLKVKDDEGLGDVGTPGMEYESESDDKIDAVTQMIEHCGCEKKKAPFVVAYSSGAYHPDPIQAIKYIVYLTNENDNILKALMHEARKVGCLNKYKGWMDRFYNRPSIQFQNMMHNDHEHEHEHEEESDEEGMIQDMDGEASED